MKRRTEKVRLLSLLLVLGLLATGCGGGDKSYEETATTTAEAYDTGAGYLSDDIYNYSGYEMQSSEAVAEEAAAEEPASEKGVGVDTSVEVQDVNRKLIRNVDIEVETETFDELLGTVEEKTQRLSGYIEQSSTYNGSSYYGRENRNANLTIRIPAENLDAFLSSLAEVSNVIRRDENVTDVTLQYVDLESHKEALVTEQNRLLQLLEQAENVEDIITIESRLSEVRYQLESMESQLRTMDNQVSYSTVYLYINEVRKLTPVDEQSVWEKISTGFVNSLWSVGNGLADFVIDFIINLPYIVLWGVILAAVILIIRAFLKGRKKRKQKRLEKQKEKEEKELKEQQEKQKDKTQEK